MKADFHDGGAKARSDFADTLTATAAGSGDATESNGVWVDRKQAGIMGLAMSAKLVIAWVAALQQDETLSLAANIQDSPASDGSSGVADFGEAYASTVVATGDTGGSTERGTTELDFDLAAADRYLRSQITPDLSASGTDTLALTAVWVFFGSDRNPISKSVVTDAR